MNTDKLLKAIQILIKDEISKTLPSLVNESVKKEMKRLLSENKQGTAHSTAQPATLITNTKQPLNAGKPHKQHKLSKNKIINQILSETTPFTASQRRSGDSMDGWQAMGFDSGDVHAIAAQSQSNTGESPTMPQIPNSPGLGVSTGNEALDRAFNRDYSQLVKKFKK